MVLSSPNPTFRNCRETCDAAYPGVLRQQLCGRLNQHGGGGIPDHTAMI
jgi:hypothetical protein